MEAYYNERFGSPEYLPKIPASCEELLALAFTALITILIHYCDREPEKEPEIIRQIEAFVKHFIKIYGK